MKKNNLKNLSAILLVILLVVSIVVVYFINKQQTIQKNKEVAMQVMEHGLETGDVASLADQHFHPDIEIEYPEAFKLPPNGTNKAKGKTVVVNIAKAWKVDTEHQVDIIDVAADKNNVAILANMDRIFKIANEKRTYENHHLMYFFQFKDGKIVKITGVFDVLNDVEQFKAEKYQLNQ